MLGEATTLAWEGSRMAAIKRGDRVRVRHAALDDEGKVGAVYAVEEWYGQPVVTVVFEGTGWDEPEIEQYYLSQVEQVDG